MDTKLNFINHTNDTNNLKYVIFQKNVAMDVDEPTVAWKVIENCGQGNYHPFTFSMNMSISTSDREGNITPPRPAQHGQLFTHECNHTGCKLNLAGEGSSPDEVEVRNDLQPGAISANIYKDGKLLATKAGVGQGQKAVFGLKPTIWIGAVSQVEEGKIMDAAIISDITTEISLLGIASADIVATGGGPGTGSKPISFTLENVVMV